MASANIYGYDLDFVSEVWEEVKCIICHLVLRQPVQNMNCGHRYCSSCFNEMKNYAERFNTKLICPVDREDIDLGMVFEDKGIHRSIRALQVKCKQHQDGCSWVGCLSDLDEHVGCCQYQSKQGSFQPNNTLSGNDDLYKQLLERIVRCEDLSVAKEKELASVRFSVKEMKEEMKTVKDLNKELKEEILQLKQADAINKKEYQAELKSLHVINEQIKEKMKQYEEQTDYILDVEDCKQRVNNQVALLEKKIENLEKSVAQTALAKTVTEVTTHINKIGKDVRSLRSDIDKTSNSTTAEIKELKTHTRNIENVLFLHDPLVRKQVKFKWVMQNYKHHFDKGEDVNSPVFFSQLSGFRFQLNIEWTGDKKQNLGLYLNFSRGENEDGLIPNLSPFKYEFELQVLNTRSGGSEKCKITSSDIAANKAENYTIRDDENTPREPGRGCFDILVWPYKDYIINDTMHFICTIFL